MEVNSFQKNTNIWERIYKEGTAGSMLKYPCEDFVVTLNRYCTGTTIKGMKLLYVGFGSGNNMVVAAEKGFDCYGVEISASALQIARQRLERTGYTAQLYEISKNNYPFDDNFFDVVVAWHVLCYNDQEGVENVLKEIKRVMKPSAILLATFPTFKEFRVSKGKHISGNTFSFNLPESNQDGAIVTACQTEEDVKQVFHEFSGLEIGYSEITVKGITNSHWLIYGTKAK